MSTKSATLASQTVTSEMLTAAGAKNVQGIYAADDTMVAGAIDALKSQGLDVKKMQKLFLSLA